MSGYHFIIICAYLVLGLLAYIFSVLFTMCHHGPNHYCHSLQQKHDLQCQIHW